MTHNGTATIPLRMAALCCQCETVFPIGTNGCPECGTATWHPVNSWMSESSAQARRRVILREIIGLIKDTEITDRAEILIMLDRLAERERA